MHKTTSSHSEVFQIVGVGSLCGDDAIGLVIAREIEKRLQSSDQKISSPAYPANLRIDFATSPVRLLDLMPASDTLVIFDAWLSDREPIGTTRKWVWPNIDIENTRFTGSHDFSLSDALLLAEHLGVLPRHVLIWGIAVAPGSINTHRLHQPAADSSLAENQTAADIQQGISGREYLSKQLCNLVPGIIDSLISSRFL